MQNEHSLHAYSLINTLIFDDIRVLQFSGVSCTGTARTTVKNAKLKWKQIDIHCCNIVCVNVGAVNDQIVKFVSAKLGCEVQKKIYNTTKDYCTNIHLSQIKL